MGTLRVVSGSARGLRLKTVPGDSTRPITDQVKEALFNILGNWIEGTIILDLFGGTGAVGIEALSRGADFVTFIDINNQAVRTIKENLSTTKFTEFSEVIKQDAFAYLRNTGREAFDLVYIAPPQYKKLWISALKLIDDYPGWLTENGLVILQINPLEWEDIELLNFYIVRRKKYGDTELIFIEKRSSEVDL